MFIDYDEAIVANGVLLIEQPLLLAPLLKLRLIKVSQLVDLGGLARSNTLCELDEAADGA